MKALLLVLLLGTFQVEARPFFLEKNTELKKCIKRNLNSSRISVCIEKYHEGSDFKQCNRLLNKSKNSTFKDLARFQCLEKFQDEITFSDCAKTAGLVVDQVIFGSNYRNMCYSIFKHDDDFTFKQCTENAKKILSLNQDDSMRFNCFEQFKDEITYEQCLDNANNMLFPTYKEIAKKNCFDHFIF